MRSRVERRATREARNAAVRLAGLEAAAQMPPPTGGHRPHPLFSEAAVNGKCPSCHGTQFRRPAVASAGAVLAVGIIWAAKDATRLVDCVTCGKRFRKG